MSGDASEVSPDGSLRLLCVERGGERSIGFEGCGWHVHPEQIVDCFYYPESISHDDAVRRFWSDILSDRFVISVEPDVESGFYAEVCEDPQAMIDDGLQPGQILRFWSGRRYLGNA